MTVPHKDDMERIDAEAAFQLDVAEKAEGSYLPEALVLEQTRLAALGPTELARQLADLTIAAALVGFASTPERVLKKLLDGYKISDESWTSKVGPELRRVLKSRGVVLPELTGPPPADPPPPPEPTA